MLDALAQAMRESDRLRFWLDAHAPRLGEGPLELAPLAGGQANAVFRLSRGQESTVLRRPPASPRPASNRSLAREARVLGALTATPVPTPALIAFCDDLEVLGVNFLIMEHVEGWLGRRPIPPFDAPGAERRQMPVALVEGLALLAQQDHEALGLGDYGKPEGFLERQVDRWLSELDSYRTSENYAGRPIPGLAYVTDWLRANTPPMQRPGIIHGDYSLANVLYRNAPPTRVAAIIDWEMSTIGDPLLDLGWLLYAYNGREQRTPPAGTFDPTDFPFRQDLAEHYAAISGRSIEHLRYYLILAQFKLGVIMERNYARSLIGRQDPARGEYSKHHVLRLFAKAEAMARGEE
jgi:aminoglycoside phosphotransferase (APT) family kinase protein